MTDLPRLQSNYEGHLAVRVGTNTVTHFRSDGTIKNRSTKEAPVDNINDWATYHTSKLSKDDLIQLRDFLTEAIEGMDR
jgi:hypothetical protein